MKAAYIEIMRARVGVNQPESEQLVFLFFGLAVLRLAGGHLATLLLPARSQQVI